MAIEDRIYFRRGALWPDVYISPSPRDPTGKKWMVVVGSRIVEVRKSKRGAEGWAKRIVDADKPVRRGNPLRRSTVAKRSTKAASRYGVYVGSSTSPTLAYVSTKKIDANKAASKLKLSGRVGIKIKQVGANPISGKVPKVGWRKEYAKAAYAAVKAPGARRKRAATIGKIRRALNPGKYAVGPEWPGDSWSYHSTLPAAKKVALSKSREMSGRTIPVYKWSAIKETWFKTAQVSGSAKWDKRNPSRRRNSAISIVGPSRARRAINPAPSTASYDNGKLAGETDRAQGRAAPSVAALKARALRNVKESWRSIANDPKLKGALKQLANSWASGYWAGFGRRAKANPGRKRNAASILMRRANPKTTTKRKAAKRSTSAASKPRTRYMVQVGETPAWVGKLKSDANKAWRKLNAAGMKGLKIFKVQVNKVVKDGWRKAFKGASVAKSRNPSKKFIKSSVPGYRLLSDVGFDGKRKYQAYKAGPSGLEASAGPRRTSIAAANADARGHKATGQRANPSFPGRKGSGQRFKACVASVSKRPGVYDPKGLCAAIGRRKYGAKGMAKLARKGRKRNPGGVSYFAKADNEKAVYSLGGVKIERAISEASALARRKGADVTLYRGKWKEDGSVGKKVRVRRIKLV